MSTPASTGRPPRPATPILDAWCREMRRRYGSPVPAAAVAEQVGEPTWYAAAWERSALNAWADGCSEATIVAHLLRPYHDLAAALEEDDVALGPEDRAFLGRVLRARQPLRTADRMRVLRLSELADCREGAA